MSLNTTVYIFVFYFLCILGPAGAVLCCPDGWTSFNGACYFFGHHDLIFQEAATFCTHYGAHLVTIESTTENAFIKSHLGKLKDNRHWIGLTDKSAEGVWKWYSTDNTATFTDWGSGQPNNGRVSNCGAIWASFSYKWVDEPCTNLFKPICEKKANVELEVLGK